MSQMSTGTEEDIEMHFDAILEVSPVNSYSHYSSPAQSAGSPTASVRHRRSQTNEHAFSSSSEGSTDDDEDEEDDDDDGEEEQDYDDDNDSQRQPPPSSSASLPDVHHAASSSPHGNLHQHQHQPGSPKFSQRNRKRHSAAIHRGRNQQPQSEFDKALLTGVPSRGHAASFFSADSTDTSDAPFTISDVVDPTGAGNPPPQPQSQASQHSWDETNTDVSVPTTTTASASVASSSIPRQGKKKERKSHRVNITATTQSSSNASITSAASLPHPSNNVASQNQIHTSASYSGSTSGRSHSPPKKHLSGNANDKSSNAVPPKPNNTTTSNDNNNNGQESGGGVGGVLPDVLTTMRQKIESMQLFDTDMMKMSTDSRHVDGMDAETRESLKRSSQQSISAAVLVSLAHKRYERRRLAAMEIEKVVRSLVQQNELERVRAILLLLSDDYVRSTSEDARKGGVVALAACAIGLKKADDESATVMECRDLIVASVIHCCQDFSQRVRYYATGKDELTLAGKLKGCVANLKIFCPQRVYSTSSRSFQDWRSNTFSFCLRFLEVCMPTWTWMSVAVLNCWTKS